MVVPRYLRMKDAPFDVYVIKNKYTSKIILNIKVIKKVK